MALPDIFKGVSDPRTLTVSFLALATAANAQAQANNTSINFIGRDIDCSTLQGQDDDDPGGLTCSFVEQVEKSIPGAALRCDPNLKDSSKEAIQQAASHLDGAHKQPALFAYTETLSAAYHAVKNGTRLIDELRETHPVRAGEFVARFAAIGNILRGFEDGKSFEAALNYSASRMEARGYKLPESTGSTVQDIEKMIRTNPVVWAYLQCSDEFREPTW